MWPTSPPTSQSGEDHYYPIFTSVINQVFRFTNKNTLVFRLTLQNESAKRSITIRPCRSGVAINLSPILVDMKRDSLPPGPPEMDDTGKSEKGRHNHVESLIPARNDRLHDH